MRKKDEIKQEALFKATIKLPPPTYARRGGEIVDASLREVGIELDAKLSSDLIHSIFHHSSPIHDGAVIIQRGRLTRAGCFLPLTHDPDVNPSYGSRHRAAIGLTELVDAVVIVVSEETGLISVVVGGKITRALEVATLKKVLNRLLEPRRLRGKKS